MHHSKPVSSDYHYDLFSDHSVFIEKLPDDIPIVPLSSIEETPEEPPSDMKKGSGKEKDGRGSTPPSKTLLKQLMKNRERVKESLSSLKIKPNKIEVVEDKNKLTAESHHNDELVSVSSGISDTRSVGSDSEMIPLTSLNRSTINSLGNSVSDGFNNSEHGYSNGNDHKINETNIPLISESDKATTHLLKSNDYTT